MHLHLRMYSSKKRVKTKKKEDVGLCSKELNLVPQEVWPWPLGSGKWALSSCSTRPLRSVFAWGALGRWRLETKMRHGDNQSCQCNGASIKTLNTTALLGFPDWQKSLLIIITSQCWKNNVSWLYGERQTLLYIPHPLADCDLYSLQ